VVPDLTDAKLSVHDHRGLELQGTDLSRVNLSRADLGGAELSRSNLTGAILKNANLGGAILSDSDLREADLSRARLIDGLGRFDENLSGDPSGAMSSLVSEVADEAGVLSVVERGQHESTYALPTPFRVEGIRSRSSSLRGARLDGADLREAIIVGCDLHGTSVNRTIFGGTVLDAELSGIAGLEHAHHRFRSFLGPRSVRSVPTPLPIKFLRGVGLTDWEIAATELYRPELNGDQLTSLLYKIHESWTKSPIEYYSVFISYSHADRDFAAWLYRNLQDRGIRCWYDKHDMSPGDDIYEQVDRGIKLWDKLLLCCSRNSLQSWWVDNEIDIAFDKERLLMKERGRKVLALVPLNLDEYLFSNEWTSGKRQQVRSRLAADFTCWKADRHACKTELDRLIKALSLSETSKQRPPEMRL